MNRWNYEMIFQFLDVLQNYPLIWDTSHVNHKSKYLKSKALHHLAEDLKTIGFPYDATDINVVKAKVKSLKDTYFAELKKVLKYQAAGKRPDYKPKLIWFNRADSIFRLTYKSKKSPSTDALVELGELVDARNSEEDDNSAEVPSFIEICASDLIPPKRSKKENEDHNYHTVSQLEKRSLTMDDEFDCVTKSWAITLKKLSLENAWEAQDKITVMLREYIRKEQGLS